MRTFWMKPVAIVLVVAMCHLTMIPMGWAEQNADDINESTASQYGLGAASVFLTIPYGLGKVVMATLGGIFGGLAYAFSGGNEAAAKAVWDTSLRGTYVITPDHLKGNRAVRFLGVPQGEEAASELPPGKSAPMAPEPPK